MLRQLQETLGDLVATTATSIPGVRECENSGRSVRAVGAVLGLPEEPITKATYVEAVASAAAAADEISHLIDVIKTAAVDNDRDRIGESAPDVVPQVRGGWHAFVSQPIEARSRCVRGKPIRCNC